MKFITFPKHVIIELTNRCNFKCSYCPNRTIKSKKGTMSILLFKKIIDQLDQKVSIDIFRRGESLIHPRFIDMIKYAHGKVKKISIATNASLLTTELSKGIINYMDFIHFSIDTKKYFTNRNSDSYDIIMKNINNFLKLNKGKVKTQVSLVRTDHSDKEIEQFVKRWIKKVDRIRIYPLHSEDGKSGSLKFQRKRTTCTKPFYEMLIFWDGMVGRCNHDWSSEYLGDVKEKTIKEIWNGLTYRMLRHQHIYLGSLKDPVCKACDSWYESGNKSTLGEVHRR